MPAKILIVDDAAFMRMMLKDILSKSGYEIIGEAENGVQAIEKYKELQPDLVTMDITMPELDGVTAVLKIREVDSQARILMVSAMGQQKLIVESLEAGALDFIVKPFQPTKVIETVKKCLDNN